MVQQRVHESPNVAFGRKTSPSPNSSKSFDDKKNKNIALQESPGEIHGSPKVPDARASVEIIHEPPSIDIMRGALTSDNGTSLLRKVLSQHRKRSLVVYLLSLYHIYGSNGIFFKKTTSAHTNL
jgi:hypothetical protein